MSKWEGVSKTILSPFFTTNPLVTYIIYSEIQKTNNFPRLGRTVAVINDSKIETNE